MNEIAGFILNGGNSSRMGSPKGSLRLGDLTFADHAANALRAICDRVYAVGGETEIEGVETIPDVAWKGENEKASIFGLRSALFHCRAPFAAVLACDMPFVTADVLKRLADRVDILKSGQADSIIPLDSNAWFQPLCAIYECERCRVILDDLLETGSLQVRDLIERMNAHTVEYSTFTDLEFPKYLFANINTPSDLANAVTIWADRIQPI